MNVLTSCSASWLVLSYIRWSMPGVIWVHPIKSDCTIIYSLIDGVAICSCALDYNYLPFQAWSFLYYPVTLLFEFWPGIARAVTWSLYVSHPVSCFNSSSQRVSLLITIFWALKLAISRSKRLRIFFWTRPQPALHQSLKVENWKSQSIRHICSFVLPWFL